MSPYEKVVGEDAAKWFPDCEDLLVWAWDDTALGRCHPLRVVAAWEDHGAFPKQTGIRDEGFLARVLEKEWLRSGLPPASLPHLEARVDSAGRCAWRMNLSDSPESVRIAVGRALLRDEALPAWDCDWENLACPEFGNGGGGQILVKDQEIIVKRVIDLDATPPNNVIYQAP